MTIPSANKHHLVATSFMLSAAAITAASVYDVWHAGSGLTEILAWQAMPTGVHVIKKQVQHLWPGIASRLGKERHAANG